LNASLSQFRAKCFHATKIALCGFAPSEKAEMAKLVFENGGVVVEPDDPFTTHIVSVPAFTFCFWGKLIQNVHNFK
ncbi:unnamed protein product, partial [Allacma fusca]